MRKYAKRNKAKLTGLFKLLDTCDLSEYGLSSRKSVRNSRGGTIFTVKLEVENEELYEASGFKPAWLVSHENGE
jgi:hypothetical protein